MPSQFQKGQVLKVVNPGGTFNLETGIGKGRLVTAKGPAQLYDPSVTIFEAAGSWHDNRFILATGTEVRNACKAGTYRIPPDLDAVTWAEDESGPSGSSSITPYVNNTSLFTTRTNKTLQDYLDE